MAFNVIPSSNTRCSRFSCRDASLSERGRMRGKSHQGDRQTGQTRCCLPAWRFGKSAFHGPRGEMDGPRPAAAKREIRIPSRIVGNFQVRRNSEGRTGMGRAKACTTSEGRLKPGLFRTVFGPAFRLFFPHTVLHFGGGFPGPSAGMSKMLKSSGSVKAATLISRSSIPSCEAVYAGFMGISQVADAFITPIPCPICCRLLRRGGPDRKLSWIFGTGKNRGDAKMWRSVKCGPVRAGPACSARLWRCP